MGAAASDLPKDRRCCSRLGDFERSKTNTFPNELSTQTSTAEHTEESNTESKPLQGGGGLVGGAKADSVSPAGSPAIATKPCIGDQQEVNYLSEGSTGPLGSVGRVLQDSAPSNVQFYEGQYWRVGVHREGTCFFHSVLSSLNAKPPTNDCSPSELHFRGLACQDSSAYRNMGPSRRQQIGQQWRKFLAEQMTSEWFSTALNVASGVESALKYYDTTTGNTITFEQYQSSYADPAVSVGIDAGRFIAFFFNVNIFYLVARTDSVSHKLSFQVYLAQHPYEPKNQSVVLYLHDRGQSVAGHFESVQRIDGRGLFEHDDDLIRCLLSFYESQRTPTKSPTSRSH